MNCDPEIGEKVTPPLQELDDPADSFSGAGFGPWASAAEIRIGREDDAADQDLAVDSRGVIAYLE